MNSIIISCAVHEKDPNAVCGQHKPDQPAQLLTKSEDIVEYAHEQRIPRSDCMDAHADLDHSWSHMA